MFKNKYKLYEGIYTTFLRFFFAFCAKLCFLKEVTTDHPIYTIKSLNFNTIQNEFVPCKKPTTQSQRFNTNE